MENPLTPPTPPAPPTPPETPEVVIQDTVDLPPPVPEPPVKSLDAAYRLGKTEPAIADIYGHLNSIKDQTSQLSGNEAALAARVAAQEAELARLKQKLEPEPKVAEPTRAKFWEHLFGGSR